jgi:hypothetical protein
MKNKIYDCEALIWFMVNGAREQRWVLRAVVDVVDGTRVRCKSCKLPVKIHRKRVASGPSDHVEHFELNPDCFVPANDND